jgi:hypothetical protein
MQTTVATVSQICKLQLRRLFIAVHTVGHTVVYTYMHVGSLVTHHVRFLPSRGLPIPVSVNQPAALYKSLRSTRCATHQAAVEIHTKPQLRYTPSRSCDTHQAAAVIHTNPQKKNVPNKRRTYQTKEERTKQKKNVPNKRNLTKQKSLSSTRCATPWTRKGRDASLRGQPVPEQGPLW